MIVPVPLHSVAQEARFLQLRSRDHNGVEGTVVAAIVLIVLGFILIAAGTLYALASRHTGLTQYEGIFFDTRLLGSRSDSVSIASSSWHGVPDRASIWEYSFKPAKPAQAARPTSPPPYIAYNGPIEPPQLPYPDVAQQERPLPDLPNALGLTFGHRSSTQGPQYSNHRRRMSTCQLDEMSARVNSVMSDFSALSETSTGRGSAKPKASSLGVTAVAFNARRSAARLLPLDDCQVSLSAAVKEASPSAKAPPALSRSRSARLLSAARKFESSRSACKAGSRLSEAPTPSLPTVPSLVRSATSKSVKTVRFAGRSPAAPYPFTGHGPPL